MGDATRDSGRPVGEEGAWSHYYVANLAALPDVHRSADLSRENAGQRTFIHHHAHGQPCNNECRERTGTTEHPGSQDGPT